MSLIANNKLFEAVELLVLIDNGLDACRSLVAVYMFPYVLAYDARMFVCVAYFISELHLKIPANVRALGASNTARQVHSDPVRGL